MGSCAHLVRGSLGVPRPWHLHAIMAEVGKHTTFPTRESPGPISRPTKRAAPRVGLAHGAARGPGGPLLLAHFAHFRRRLRDRRLGASPGSIQVSLPYLVLWRCLALNVPAAVSGHCL